MSCFVRADNVRIFGHQRVDHHRQVVQRQRRLGDVSQRVLGRQGQGGDILGALHQNHRAVGQLPHRADDLGMALVADQHNHAVAPIMDFRLAVHFHHQRTGGVDGQQLAPLRLCRHGFRHAMRGKHHRMLAIRHFRQFLDENRALALQPFDHIAIMHDFMPHIDGRAEFSAARVRPRRWPASRRRKTRAARKERH